MTEGQTTELDRPRKANAGVALVRKVNDDIRRFAAEGDSPYFCECHAACFRAVWLDVLGYDAATGQDGASLLAHGHEAEVMALVA